jgi:hypothetical protein
MLGLTACRFLRLHTGKRDDEEPIISESMSQASSANGTLLMKKSKSAKKRILEVSDEEVLCEIIAAICERR